MAQDIAAITTRLELAREIAREAGELTLRYFQRSGLTVNRKADDSPVTVADREAEKLLRARIEAVFPDDGIIGEEFGQSENDAAEYQWIVDPIDGTKSFICGVPLYGNLVAVTHGDRAELGVMNFPALSECVYAATGQGAWYARGNDPPQPAKVSACTRLADAVFLTSEVKTFYEKNREAAYFALQDRAQLSRTWGDCYGYALVATGRADVMVDPEMNVWDAAALQPILEEADGTFTNWKGRPTIHSGEGVATNGRLLDEVLQAIRAA